MFSKPTFNEFLARHDCVDEIYDALNDDDLSEVVMTSFRVLKRLELLPCKMSVYKSGKISEEFRNKGNVEYKKKNNQNALGYYNKAIVFAPNNSRQLKIAISNRSALLKTSKANNASLKDIETCFAMGCPDDIIDKLKKRKEEVICSKSIEDNFLNLSALVDKYIFCGMANHPEVPCASRYIKITGTVPPKIVASVDIRPGIVIACEKAYVTQSNVKDYLYSCYYCQRYSLNLTPCDNCCYVLFCDDTCKRTCYEEYHKYECHIMTDIHTICRVNVQSLMLKAVFKMRSQCKSWTEFIDASYKTGIDSVKTSSIEQIYDSNNLSSILNLRDDKPFIYGIYYNASFHCATLLHSFEKIPLFYPDDPNEKLQVMRALARTLMFVSLYQTPLKLQQSMTNLDNKKTYLNEVPQKYGLFSFIGKLKHSCKPNLFVVNKNNELILLTMRQIKRGEELTISFPEHLHDNMYTIHIRNYLKNLLSGNLCDCPVCAGSPPKEQLSSFQMAHYRATNFISIARSGRSENTPFVFKEILMGMDILSNVPYSDEYKEFFSLFRNYVMTFEAVKGLNFCI